MEHLAASASGDVFAGYSPRIGRNRWASVVMKLDRLGHEAWRHRVRGSAVIGGVDEIRALLPSRNGDVLVAGAPDDADGREFTVTRLRGRDGRELWRSSVGGASPATPHAGIEAAALTSDEDVIAAGTVRDEHAGGTVMPILVRFDGITGAERWRLSSSALVTSHIALDAVGDVIAAGETFDDGRHTVTVEKVSRVTPAITWRSRIDGCGAASDLAVDGAGDILLAVSTIEPGGNDFGVVKVAGASGDVQWIHRESGSTGRWQEAEQVVVDSSGDVFAAGMTNNGQGPPWDSEGFVFTVVGLDGTDGSRRWIYQAPATTGYGFARELDLAPNGLLIAAGETGDPRRCQNAFIVALDPTDGHVVSSTTFDGPTSAPDCRRECPYHSRCPPIDNDEMTAMAITTSGNMFLGLRLIHGSGLDARPRASVRGLPAVQRELPLRVR